MRRAWWISAICVMVLVALSLIALPDTPQWTTASPAAREAFEAALEAQARLYHADVRRHLERAVALDPDFVTAKLELALVLDDSESHHARELLAEVLAAESDNLQPLEQLMVARTRAIFEDQSEQAEKLLDEYLELFPDESWALHQKASSLASRGEHRAAEQLYHCIIEVDPNWALAYNQLGYMAMADGRFAEAEQHFTSYRFIAPDQANPHDSLGELLLIRGHYREAARCFTSAVEIREDFVKSYEHLIIAFSLLGETGAAQAVAERLAATGGLPRQSMDQLSCAVRWWRLLQDPGWLPVAEIMVEDTGCLADPSSLGVGWIAAHRAACAESRLDLALHLEDRVAERIDGNLLGEDLFSAELHHMRGVRSASEGMWTAALDCFHAADQQLSFRTADQGLFKLYNLLLMVEGLLVQGHGEQAHAILARVREVNATMADGFERNGLRLLDRG